MKLEGVVQKVASLIVSACDPEKIVLFGSQAKGRQTVDSDLDILVIGSFNGSPFLVGHELRQLLHFCPMRIDLHVTTPQEVEAARANPFGFLGSVLSHGRVIYCRRPSTQRA